ncbi:MAG: hypothetical protein HC933_15460 [Pleurocapsa sp. SU_196_0]|nr:hypothetical protein [Pleurocapsa sp. SU_196_0]
MNFNELMADGLLLAHELSAKPVPGEDKLEKLTDCVQEVGESVDDLVVFVPGGFGSVAKILVDNPAVDGLQRELLWKPLAQGIYMAWKTIHRVQGEAGVQLAISEYRSLALAGA